jgi:MFS family permease
MLRDYASLLARDGRFVAFGFTMALCSSFGQTFYIALSGGEIRESFGLSNAGFGGLYSTATLLSAACLIWAGRRIDDVDLRLYGSAAVVLLVAACLAMAAAPTALLLGGALFLMRFSGQGLLSHTAMTSMARYFDEQRGKAMAVAGLGFPAGEAVLPTVGVALIAAIGWRQTWLLVGLTVLLLALPVVHLLLVGHARRHRHLLERTALPGSATCPACGYDLAGHHGAEEAACPECGLELSAPSHVHGGQRQWTRVEVLRDPRFYVMVPALVAPGFIVTGLFFHQVPLVEDKGWSMTWLASCFVAFAGAQLPASLLAGPLVDRFGATRLLRFYLLPLAAGLACLAALEHPATAIGFMALIGCTSGVGGTVVGAMWAEVYGVTHLGAIRALASSLMVFSTALSPVSMGWLIDLGWSMELISLVCLGYALGATVLLAPLFRR